MDINNKPTKTLGPKSAHLVVSLHEKNQTIFRLNDVREILGLSNAAAKIFVWKLVQRGVADRLKSGLYILVPFSLGTERQYMGNPYLVAHEWMKGQRYYLSHQSAMDLHGMTTHPQLVVTVTTANRPPMNQRIKGVPFVFVKAKPKNMQWGLTHAWVTKQEKVFVSDIERTILDGLKQPEHSGGVSEVSRGLWLKRDKIKIPTFLSYANKLKVQAVTRRLGYLLELHKLIGANGVKKLQSKLKPGTVKLDALLPNQGPTNAKWGLRLNISKSELLSNMAT